MTLSWVGTGRCLASMDFTAQDYAALQHALVSATSQMKRDGWWLDATEHPEKEKRMKFPFGAGDAEKPGARSAQGVLHRGDAAKEGRSPCVAQRFREPDAAPGELERFLYCYAIMAFDLTEAMCLGLAALFVRQFGHAVLEPDAHEKEMTLLGYTTYNKTLIVLGYSLIPFATMLDAGSISVASFMQHLPQIAEYWWYWTQFVIVARIAYLIWKFSFRTSMIWYVKLVTDPLTDIVAYFPRRQRA